MRSILKDEHKQSHFPLRLLAASSVKPKTRNTRTFYLRARSFDCPKTINYDQNSFKILINVSNPL